MSITFGNLLTLTRLMQIDNILPLLLFTILIEVQLIYLSTFLFFIIFLNNVWHISFNLFRKPLVIFLARRESCIEWGIVLSAVAQFSSTRNYLIVAETESSRVCAMISHFSTIGGIRRNRTSDYCMIFDIILLMCILEVKICRLIAKRYYIWSLDIN